MKAIIQRVRSASVTVDGKLISSIGRGIVALIGIHQDDNLSDVEYMADKLINIRAFEDDQGKRWSKNIKDLNLEILCVSQFTLYHTMKGNKPDFRLAMAGEQSKSLYSELISSLKQKFVESQVKDGVFGAYMVLQIENDGPVTLVVESPNKK